MMKKICLTLLFLSAASVSFAASRKFEYVSNIGPAFSSSNVTIASSTYRNCLEFAVFKSSVAYTLYILDGNTTSYQLTGAAGALTTNVFNFEPFCGTAGNTMQLKIDPAPGTNREINYGGFTGR